MTPVIEALKKLATQKITRGKVQPLEKAHADACSLFERLYPKTNDEDTTAEFESACDELESALSDLESAISDLDMAEEKDEREDAVFMIKAALEQSNSAFEEIMVCAIIGPTPRPEPAPSASEYDAEFARQVSEALNKAGGDRDQALDAWVQSAGTPEQVSEREQKLNQLLRYLQNRKQPPPAPPP